MECEMEMRSIMQLYVEAPGSRATRPSQKSRLRTPSRSCLLRPASWPRLATSTTSRWRYVRSRSFFFSLPSPVAGVSPLSRFPSRRPSALSSIATLTRAFSTAWRYDSCSVRVFCRWKRSSDVCVARSSAVLESALHDERRTRCRVERRGRGGQ